MMTRIDARPSRPGFSLARASKKNLAGLDARQFRFTAMHEYPLPSELESRQESRHMLAQFLLRGSVE
jgi:hypothetical protein